MTLERRLRSIPLGKISRPLPDFTAMSPDKFGDAWTGVVHPLDPARRAVRNIWRPGGEGHVTMTTPRDLGLGVTAADSLTWLYLPGDLKPNARNLFWQCQMEDSPIAAVSTGSKALRYEFVERVNGTTHRHDLGAIDFGREACFVCAYKLAERGGFVELWWAYDRMPDVSAHGIRFEGDTWQNGRAAHCTLGEYAAGKTVETGYFSRYGRAASPARSIELAMAA